MYSIRLATHARLYPHTQQIDPSDIPLTSVAVYQTTIRLGVNQLFEQLHHASPYPNPTLYRNPHPNHREL